MTKITVMNEFLFRVLEEMEFLNVSKADLSRAIDVPDSTIRSWFKKNTVPAADTALRIARFLDVPLEYLIDGTRPAEKKTPYLSEYDKTLIQDARGLIDEDRAELLAYIKMKKSMYRMIKADNGKTAIVKDC